MFRDTQKLRHIQNYSCRYFPNIELNLDGYQGKRSNNKDFKFKKRQFLSKTLIVFTFFEKVVLLFNSIKEKVMNNLNNIVKKYICVSLNRKIDKVIKNYS